ncbi:MAG: nucleotidyltransferase family protein [Thiocapsa sp.]|nr:nucleotidyltransferase family protein [Thiocapsa sp.]MCG6897841.1 nucleotidyltransferase family protein [Thiocapsa sp.]
MKGIVGVLLAAGAARRFGAPKLLQPLHDGTPLVLAAARNLTAAVPCSIAVVRPGDAELADALGGLGLRVVENPIADQGMGPSLAAGVRAVADADGWLVALGDMPWIRPATIRMLAEALGDGASMVAPLHRGRRGHPVGFASRWGGELCRLRGEAGARRLISAHADELLSLPVADAGVLDDVDRPGDLARECRARGFGSG